MPTEDDRRRVNPPAATGRLLTVQGDGFGRVVVPPWGYVEALELRPRAGLLENMDAGVLWALTVELRRERQGAPEPVDVLVRVRDTTTTADRRGAAW